MKEPIQAAEELIVIRAQLGDETAFQRLVHTYTQPLFLYCRSFSLDSDRCEDIVQEVWLVALRSLGKLRSISKFRSWLFGIARNKARQHLGKKARDEIVRQNVIESSESSLPDPSFEDYLELIPNALELISIRHREVLTLRFLNQMNYTDIADLLGIGIGTVKSRVHYAKVALHAKLESMKNERS